MSVIPDPTAHQGISRLSRRERARLKVPESADVIAATICPTCKAPAGTKCTDEDRPQFTRWDPHPERIYAYQAANVPRASGKRAASRTIEGAQICPQCNAAEGARCTDNRGNQRPPHQIRIDVYQARAANLTGSPQAAPHHARRKRAERNAGARVRRMIPLDQVEPYTPGPDRGFIPRNQRTARRDEAGRLVNTEDVHDELRRLTP